MDWTEPTAWGVFAITLIGVHLNNGRHRACFVLWWVSNAASFAIHAGAGMTGMAARDAAFFVLAIVGYRKWGRTAVQGPRSKVDGPTATARDSRPEDTP